METLYETMTLADNITNYVYINNKAVKVTRQFLKNNGYRRLCEAKYYKHGHKSMTYGKPVQIRTSVKDKKPIEIDVCNGDIQKQNMA